jgi:hypothetical protein
VAERGHRNSRGRKLASTIAFRGAEVDRHLADLAILEDGFEGEAICGCSRIPAWSKKRNRKFGLKKQILSGGGLT